MRNSKMNIVALAVLIFSSTPAFAQSKKQIKTKATSHVAGLSKNSQTSTRGSARLQNALMASADSIMEASFCAPGMPCAQARPNHLPYLHKTAIIRKDRRVAVDTLQDRRFAPIGVVQNNRLKTRATAFLIEECWVLTNAHAVVGKKKSSNLQNLESGYDPKNIRVLEAVDLLFAVGWQSDGKWQRGSKAKLVAMGEYWPNQHKSEEDWALLRLDDCLGKKEAYGFLQVYPAEMKQVKGKLDFVAMAGYPGDRDHTRTLSVDPKCTVYTTTPGEAAEKVWSTDCNSKPGSSGSPLYVVDKDPAKTIFALGLMTSDFEPRNAEEAKPDYVYPGYHPDVGTNVLPFKTFIHKIEPHVWPDKVASAQR